MIISKTPFRISFIGGGTDYPAWYREHGGAVLSTTIDKYCYITCRHLPPFFQHRHRIVYSKTEQVNNIDEIIHPAVRETFRYLNIQAGLEIHHDGDLPARSGLGSSSTFTVGLINALYALQGKMVSKEQLAHEAIHIEQNMIKENVGSQDQVNAAYGGFNKIQFTPNNQFQVTPVTLSASRLEEFQSHLMLFFTGLARNASDIAKGLIEQIPVRHAVLCELFQMVEEGITILNNGDDILRFGRLLHHAWELKKSISSEISNSSVNEIYETGISAGAIGGKLLGAGGGGFILFMVPPSMQQKVREALRSLLYVPFKFENTGSQIIYYNNNI